MSRVTHSEPGLPMNLLHFKILMEDGSVTDVAIKNVTNKNYKLKDFGIQQSIFTVKITAMQRSRASLWNYQKHADWS